MIFKKTRTEMLGVVQGNSTMTVLKEGLKQCEQDGIPFRTQWSGKVSSPGEEDSLTNQVWCSSGRDSLFGS